MANAWHPLEYLITLIVGSHHLLGLPAIIVSLGVAQQSQVPWGLHQPTPGHLPLTKVCASHHAPTWRQAICAGFSQRQRLQPGVGWEQWSLSPVPTEAHDFGSLFVRWSLSPPTAPCPLPVFPGGCEN